jgi:hypothetical protein
VGRRRNQITWQFDARPVEMLESPALRVASLSCRRILDRIAVELAHHGGHDNGKLPVTFDQFVEFGVHRHAISPALREGEALGLFIVTERGRASAGEFRSPNKYMLPYLYCGSNPPINEWKKIKTIEEAELIARRARDAAAPSCARKTRTKKARTRRLNIAEHAS